MASSLKLGRLAGIEIGVHYTWLFAFFLVAWPLAVGYFPSNYPGWGEGTYWIVGVIAALALFASVLVHELSHSFVARARGQEVESITLFIFGGVSNLKGEAHEARDEFLVAVVGPVTSLVLAGIFWAVGQALPSDRSPIGGILGYLAMINLLLGLFNLLPGFPLDGGRVFRSIVWGITGSLRRATNIASVVGQGIGFLLIFWGVSQIFGGNFLNGLWIGFIGWFLNNAAEATRQQQTLQEHLRGVRVVQLMDPHPAIVAPDQNVQDFVFQDVLHGRRAVLVEEQGRLVGIVSITDAKKVPREDWASTPIGSIMTPMPLKTIGPEADAGGALQLLVDGSYNQLPVVTDRRVIGMLSRSDVLRFLQARHELGIGGLTRRPTHQGAP